MARFEREAKLLASLNHPNIASIYGFETGESIKAIVLELVDGPTVAERISEGAIAVEEATAIARQIASALEAGHEAGIIHRDLKPANVKLKEDGTIKVLDYGLAKALDVRSTGSSAEPELSQSPTRLRQGYGGQALDGTAVGTVLGTAAYMSPEQAKGKSVDKRADIWAFGAVLYEMLTGRPAFEGEGVSDTLAAVLRDEPSWSALPSDTPPGLRQVVRLCLTKDPKLRARDMGDVRLALDGAFGLPTAELTQLSRPTRRSVVPWLIAASALVVALIAVFWRRPPPEGVVRRLQLSTRMTEEFHIPVLSPNGRLLVGVGREPDGRAVLWRRSLDSDEDVLIPGTEGADDFSIFWAPDSARVAFQTGDELKIVDFTGAPPTRIAETPANVYLRGGAWSSTGVILVGESTGAIRRVSELGGTLKDVTRLDPSRFEESHRFPVFLPDEEHFLFTVRGNEGYRAIRAGSLETGESAEVVRAFSSLAFAEPGYLLYARDDKLLAQPFDPSSLVLTGSPKTLLSGIRTNVITGGVDFTISQNGMLAYRPARSIENELTWVDRTGRVLYSPVTGTERDANWLRVSGDERFAIVSRDNPATGKDDLWRLDLTRGLSTRLVSNPQSNSVEPVLSPDGRRVAYYMEKGLRMLDIETPGAEAVAFDLNLRPTDWSPDGKFLILDQGTISELGKSDVVALDLEREEEPAPIPIVATGANEYDGRLSPDGRFIAYVSDQTGRDEVWIASFPDGASPERVSRNGGSGPRFRQDGKELFFVSPADEAVAVPISLGASIQIGEPVVLWSASFRDIAGRPEWEVLSNGERFVISDLGPTVARKGEIRRSALNVVLNWPLIFGQ